MVGTRIHRLGDRCGSAGEGGHRAAPETEAGKAGQPGSTAAPSSLLLLEQDNSFLKNIVGVHSLHDCMETNLSLSLYTHVEECFFFSFVFNSLPFFFLLSGDDKPAV